MTTHAATGGAIAGALRVLDGVQLALAGIAALILAAAALLTTMDVLLRNLGGGGIAWVLEVVEYGLYAATFLAAPWVLRVGGHVRVDVLVSALGRRGARFAEFAANGLGLLISLAILRHGVRAAMAAHESGALVFKQIVFPEWWLLTVLPVGALLLAIEFAVRLLGLRETGAEKSPQAEAAR